MKEASGGWHLRIFKKSILKQAKFNAIRRFLPDLEGKACLDLGGDNGIISYLLRREGGVWCSADLSDRAVASIRSLVGTNVFETDGETLPFADRTFDVVVIIDYLEHIPHDREFISELARVMKKSGMLIINVPYIKRRSMIRWAKRIGGISDEGHGHLRPGYTRAGLESLLGKKFEIMEARTYSKFFTELLDLLIQLGYGNSADDGSRASKGLLITEEELNRKERRFKLYSLLYPFMRLFACLDALAFFTQGHKLIVRARNI